VTPCEYSLRINPFRDKIGDIFKRL